ncbi:O-antigen ligase family protein [Aestuariibaculum sp. YM273]|uniref:O-antigen ligase family protein n=1 Tax=Aestuariibaculum sp. YM273 TaxID=3070659 RepID=UPI0027DE6652|nr:O-antigen ligase family protein [Aestuariibaculum sp. YM273]WMI66626.1 O-antigen ligase family protein [Aestuariibaculum sp. YM273]
MKENINSITIICCSLGFFIQYFKTDGRRQITKELIFLTLMFWLFLIHELVSTDLSVKTILLNLPFLVFPLLFYFRPIYIGEKEKSLALKVFQGAVLIVSIYFLWFFLDVNSVKLLFNVSPENIPFFRDYVFRHAKLDIHPTYFSMFLLISFTLSIYHLVTNKLNFKREKYLFIVNVIMTTFMLFLFSSRIIMVIYLLTLVLIVCFFFKKLNRKHKIITLIFLVSLGFLLLFSFKEILFKRFIEVFTEYKVELKGNHHNSTNIRVAIYNCAKELYYEMPFLGYGDSLQGELNSCYESKYDSNFSKIQPYNTHNYYLNILLYGGWICLLIFCYYIYVVFKCIKGSKLSVLLLFQMLLVCTTENFLSRHFGIVTFTYFLGMFIFIKELKEVG